MLDGFDLPHAEDNIRAALSAGRELSIARSAENCRWNILLEMYTRSPRFAGCLRVLLEAGASLNDPALEAVLLDDAARLRAALDGDRDSLYRRRSLSSACSSLDDAWLLHVAAEFNSLDLPDSCLRVAWMPTLRPGSDDEGLGGQTPLFHTVNCNQNYSRPMMELLVEAGANLEISIQGPGLGRRS